MNGELDLDESLLVVLCKENIFVAPPTHTSYTSYKCKVRAMCLVINYYLNPAMNSSKVSTSGSPGATGTLR